MPPDEQITDVIKHQKTPMIAFNDEWCPDLEHKQSVIHDAFNAILKEKSDFEL